MNAELKIRQCERGHVAAKSRRVKNSSHTELILLQHKCAEMTQNYDKSKRRKAGIEAQQSRIEACELWQGIGYNEAQTAVVLECVFEYLAPRDLWHCGSVCRAWRRAADDSSLWRHLLLPHATPNTLRAIAATQNDELAEHEWSWLKEYALQSARWERRGQLQARGPGSVPLLCAALHDSGALLALVDEDAHVTIWEHTNHDTCVEEQWLVRWSGVVSPEWRGVSLVQWAPHAARLLLAGRLALVDRHEMLVVHFDEEWCSRVVCRSACGPGGAGCWVDDDTFLSLRLRLLAPGRACSTLWLNAATLEVYSEFTGVTTPLLRIYNEAAAHISHILVAEVPTEELERCPEESKNNNGDLHTEPNASYYYSIRPDKAKSQEGKKQRILVAAGGLAGGVRGEAQALLLWALPSLEMPLLWVGDQLAQRVQQHRERARAPEPAPGEQEPPDENEVRALCSRPTATLCLGSRIFGIVLHPRGGCVWATTEAGATCVSLPALTSLLHLPRIAAANETSLPSHFVQPCGDDDYFVTPVGVGSGRVCLWTTRSGRCGAQLQHGAPAIAAFLLPRRAPRTRRYLLVLATDALHIARNLTCDKKPGRARRGSCTPVPESKCTPCEAASRPACRAPPTACPTGVRRVCCAPTGGQRPPCEPPQQPRPKTCEHDNNPIQKTLTIAKLGCSGAQKYVCGAQLDRVAMRLEAAKRARRLDYEREIATQSPPLASISIPYKLTDEHQCLRATDGRDYTLASKPNNNARCSSDRIPPPSCPLNLKSDDNCQIHRGHHLDPCAHHPRIFLEIDRSRMSNSPNEIFDSSKRQSDDLVTTDKPCKQMKATTSFTTRIIEGLKRNGNSVCPRQICKPQSIEKTPGNSNDSWCKSSISPDIPVRCKEPSLIDRLRQRPGGMSGQICKSQRQLHTNSCNKCSSTKTHSARKEEKPDLDKVTTILHEQMQLEEAGKGRVVTTLEKGNNKKNIGAGGLELKVPPSAEAVRVRVSLDYDTLVPTSCKASDASNDLHLQTLSSCKSTSGNDSWLSIKNIQKKLSGYCKNEVSAETKKSQDFGQCQRQSKKSVSEKQSSCSLPPSNENKCEKPPSSCSQPPRQQSPCSVKVPKETMSRYSSIQNIFVI